MARLAFSMIEKVAAKPTDECAPIYESSNFAPSSVTFGDSFSILEKPLKVQLFMKIASLTEKEG